MSYQNPRLKLEMTMLQSMVAFAEGNPGAANVLARIVKEAIAIDPDDVFQGLGAIASLDNLDCYGCRIWMFYNDVCGQDLPTMIGVMRASQLGFTTDGAINRAIDGDKSALEIPDLLAKVKERLPAFAFNFPRCPTAGLETT